jgi:hypothetical protein
MVSENLICYRKDSNTHAEFIPDIFSYLSELVPEQTINVPIEPTEDQWGGLARDIVMWMDMEPKTPRALFKHLERSGRDIPQWLRDEPDMKNLDKVPPKGTRAVIIYKAMIEGCANGSKKDSG